MTAQLDELALSEWRDAVRLLDELAPADPDYEVIHHQVVQLGVAHARICSLKAGNIVAAEECRTVISTAEEVLEAVRAKHPECCR